MLPGVRDSQRGAKMFPAEVCEKVFSTLLHGSWGFDVEILTRCRAERYELIEVPIRWQHVGGGQIRPAAYLDTLREVWAIRRRVRNPERRRKAGTPADRADPAEFRAVSHPDVTTRRSVAN